jgi:hypothetical protein
VSYREIVEPVLPIALGGSVYVVLANLTRAAGLA